MKPVSYTHLDVHKRQHHPYAFWAIIYSEGQVRAVKAWAVIGVVGVWLIGYFLMGRLDRLLARVRPEAGAAEERPPAPREPDAPLLFCGHDEQAGALSNALTGCLPGLQTLQDVYKRQRLPCMTSSLQAKAERPIHARLYL